jgi:hypothetical protein
VHWRRGGGLRPWQEERRSGGRCCAGQGEWGKRGRASDALVQKQIRCGEVGSQGGRWWWWEGGGGGLPVLDRESCWCPKKSDAAS